MNAPFVLDRPDIIHGAVCDTLCAVFPTISREALLSSEKLNHTTSWVRQVGMYLMSARLHVTQMTTAAHFGRDRTTISHACQLVAQEADQRPMTAAFLKFLEEQVLAVLEEAVMNEDGGAF